jgi:hypothetical protein
MIKFFRRIRQQLLNSGQLKKYSFYAFGEIFLVVIGILIALQINTWNQNKINAKNETLYLNQILDELKTDNIDLNQQKNRFQNNLHTIESFLKELNEEDNQKAFNESFRAYLNNVWGPIYFGSNNATFEEMKSSAKLGIIADKSLRNKIVQLYNNLSLTEKVFEFNTNFIEPMDQNLSFEYGFAKYLKIQSGMFDKYISEEEIFQIKQMKPLLESNAAVWNWTTMELLPLIETQQNELSSMIKEIEDYLNQK